MSTRRATLTVIAASIIAIGMLPRASVASETPDSALFELPLGTFVSCGECMSCGTELHTFSAGEGPDRAYGEDHPGACAGGWCSVAHPESVLCYEGAIRDTNEVWNVLRADELLSEDLRRVVAEVGGNASYNTARHAIQVQGCGGNIILSVPLTAEQAKALEE